MKRNREGHGTGPGEFDSQGNRRRQSSDSQSLGSQQLDGSMIVELEGSQSGPPQGSQLDDSQIRFILDQLATYDGDLEARLQPYSEHYGSILSSQDTTMVEEAFGISGGLSFVATTAPQDQDSLAVVKKPVTTADESVEETTGEDLRDTPESEEVVEVQLDEDMSVYLEQMAEQIFAEALKEHLDDVLGQVRAQSEEYADYPLRLLRLEIMDNPRLLDKIRRETLDGLKAEIWKLLRQEDMVES